MGTVKNVIKGQLAHDEIERLTIIDTEELTPIYSGTLNNFLKPSDMMKTHANIIKNTAVKKSVVDCGNQLFIFL